MEFENEKPDKPELKPDKPELKPDKLKGKHYFIIRDRFLSEIDEKEFNDKKYSDDYMIPSRDENLIIIDLDKRNIMPYTANLLNSMNDLSFTRFSRWTFFTLWFVVGLCIILIVRGTGSSSNDIVTALTPIINKQVLSNSVPDMNLQVNSRQNNTGSVTPQDGTIIRRNITR